MASPGFNPSVITTEAQSIINNAQTIIDDCGNIVIRGTALVTELPLAIVELATYLGSMDWTSLLPDPLVVFKDVVTPSKSPELEPCSPDTAQPVGMWATLGKAIDAVRKRLWKMACDYWNRFIKMFTDLGALWGNIDKYRDEFYKNINKKQEILIPCFFISKSI